jgi:hypothetical protein
MAHETGVDVVVDACATLSDGARIFSPGWYRQAERRLKTAQRRVSRRKKGGARRAAQEGRRKKGGARRRKAVQLLAKAHQTVRQQRQDFHHKTALTLVRASDVIYHEDVQTANMLRDHHLAKGISDAGWSHFLRVLHAKAVWAVREGVATHIVQRIAIGQLRCPQGVELLRCRVQVELGGQDGVHAVSRSYVQAIGKPAVLMRVSPASWPRRLPPRPEGAGLPALASVKSSCGI